MCFAEANQDHRYDKLIQGADEYLKANQWGENQPADKSDPPRAAAATASTSGPTSRTPASSSTP